MIITALALNDRDARPIAATKAFAKRLGEPVMLVHVLSPLGRGDNATDDRRDLVIERLIGIAEGLRSLGLDVQPEILDGDIVGALHDCASRIRPALMILGGRDGEPYRGTNRVAERLSRRLPCPFLVTGRVGAAVNGTSSPRLRAFVALDHTAASDAAIAQVRELRAVMPLDCDVMSFYWPPEAQRRLGLPRSATVAADPVVEGILVSELRGRLGELPGTGELTVRAAPIQGTLGMHIPEEARRHSADLVIVGSHQRGAVGGFLHGAVTQQLLQECEIPVLFAPLAARQPRGRVDEPRRILVATDLSDFGNRAIAYAYSYFRLTGATVEIMHVLTTQSETKLRSMNNQAVRFLSDSAELARGMLEGLTPESADSYDVSSAIRVESGEDVARHVVDRARLTNADAICMASHGVGRICNSLGLSVVNDVVRLTDRPVLLVR